MWVPCRVKVVKRLNKDTFGLWIGRERIVSVESSAASFYLSILRDSLSSPHRALNPSWAHDWDYVIFYALFRCYKLTGAFPLPPRHLNGKTTESPKRKVFVRNLQVVVNSSLGRNTRLHSFSLVHCLLKANSLWYFPPPEASCTFTEAVLSNPTWHAHEIHQQRRSNAELHCKFSSLPTDWYFSEGINGSGRPL